MSCTHGGKHMITNAEIRNTLVQKFADENCYFTAKDIIITKEGDSKWITIKDYEHCPFKLHTEDDDYFGHIVWIYRYDHFDGETTFANNIVFCDSKYEYKFTNALVQLGYYIASRF